MSYKVFISKNNKFDYVPDNAKNVILFRVVTSKSTNTTRLESYKGIYYEHNAREWTEFYKKNKKSGFTGYSVSNVEGKVGQGSVWFEVSDDISTEELQSKAIQIFIDYRNKEIKKLENLIQSQKNMIRILENFKSITNT